MSLSIISLNVNGIRDKTKRTSIFHWLKEKNADLCFIQESHCESEDDIKVWSSEWGGDSYWANYNSFSRGVAVLVKPKLKLEIRNVIRDPNGRYIWAEIENDDKNIKILNIYAPNNGNDRDLFFKNMKTFIHKNIQNTPTELVVGGDFNCTLNVNIDRRKNKQSRAGTDKGTKELLDLMHDCSLEDVWRRRHPKQRRYTYFKTNSRSASRIDMWLLSKSLDSSVTKDHILIGCNTQPVI